MMSWLSDLFGPGNNTIRQALQDGAVIGLNSPIVLCCSTGAHCWEAAAILREAGITRIHNGGSWQSVLRIMNKIY